MCPDKDLLSAYFDGELDEPFASKIESHIAECVACEHVLDTYNEVSEILRNAEEPDMALSLSRTREFLRGRFSSLRPAPVWKRRLLIPAPVLAAVATIVIGLGVGLGISLSKQSESQVFDSVTGTRIESVQFVSFDAILEYLDARGNGSAFIFTLPREAKFRFYSEPTLIKASDYKRGVD